MFILRGNYFSRFSLLVNSSYRLQSRNMSSAKKPILYGDEASPPVRFVMMTASLLNVDLNFHKIDLFKEENKSDFYKRINPLQKVPALLINGEVLCDSHAIALYMCRVKNNNDLYPEELVLRSKIDEMMYFNSGVLFPIDSEIFTGFFAGQWPIDKTKIYKWHSALDYLEYKLNKHHFLTGDKMRLCDICCGTTVSSMEILVPVLDRQERVKKWLEILKSLSCFKINVQGLDRLQSFVNAVRSSQ